jgi:chitodextrinase
VQVVGRATCTRRNVPVRTYTIAEPLLTARLPRKVISMSIQSAVRRTAGAVVAAVAVTALVGSAAVAQAAGPVTSPAKLRADVSPPTTPSNVRASVSGSTVTVTWNASSDDVGVSGYEVLRNGVLTQTVTSGLSAVLTLQPANVDLSYQVRAFDVAGNRSNASAPVVVRVLGPDTVKPTLPTNLVATVQANATVVLGWTASTDDRGVTGYDVFRNGVVVATVPTAGATLTAQPTNTNLNYQVQAFDAAGNRSTKTASVVVNIDATNPKAPTNLAATVQPNATVALTWTASTDNVGVAKYAIWRNGVEIQQVTATSASLTAQPTNSNLNYQVQAIDAAGNRSLKTASVLVNIDTTNPKVPTNLTATVKADKSVVLTWTASTDNVAVTSYAIWRNGVEIQQLPGTTVTLTGQPLDQNLYFQVQALDGAGNRSSKTASALVKIDGTNPKAPTNLAGSVKPDKSIVLTWTASTDNVGVAKYAIWRNGVEIQQVTGTTVTLTGQPVDQNLNFQVQAIDAAGNRSLKTASVLLVILSADITKPTVPTNLSVVVKPDKSVVLTWTASTDNRGVTGYAIWRSGTEIRQVTSGTTVTLTGQPLNTTLYFQVQAYDAAGNRSSKTASVAVIL